MWTCGDCVCESGAGGGIQSVMQKCLPCTECEILKTAACGVWRLWIVWGEGGRGRKGSGCEGTGRKAHTFTDIHIHMYVWIFQRAKAISGGSYSFAAGTARQSRAEQTRDRPEDQAKPSQTNNASRCAVVKFSFSSLPLLFLWAKTAGDSVSLLLLLLLLGEGRVKNVGKGAIGVGKAGWKAGPAAVEVIGSWVTNSSSAGSQEFHKFRPAVESYEALHIHIHARCFFFFELEAVWLGNWQLSGLTLWGFGNHFLNFDFPLLISKSQGNKR